MSPSIRPPPPPPPWGHPNCLLCGLPQPPQEQGSLPLGHRSPLRHTFSSVFSRSRLEYFRLIRYEKKRLLDSIVVDASTVHISPNLDILKRCERRGRPLG